MVQPASVDLRLGALVPRLPQPSRHGDRPARAAQRPDRAGRGRRRRVVRDPPRRVLPRPHRGVGRAAGRHRRPHRRQVVARPPRADRARDRRLLRPRLEGHADARAQQPHARPDQALAGTADRPALVHDARPAAPSARTAIRDLGSHYHGQVEATESRYEGGPATSLRCRIGCARLDQRLFVLAAEEADGVETPFFVAGIVFSLWAVFIGVSGLRPESFPASASQGRAIAPCRSCSRRSDGARLRRELSRAPAHRLHRAAPRT